ncbi:MULTISPECIES: hypothetical protein [unclassified Wolbachia]|nr:MULTISPECIES: hypothetical protein [unclassified Wolbachia]
MSSSTHCLYCSDIAKVTYDNLKNKNSSFRYLLAEFIPRMNRGMT